MMTPDMLQDLAYMYDGFIPDVLDLTDTDRHRIASNILSGSDDGEVIDYIRENSELRAIYDMAPEDAVQSLRAAVWAACEDSVSLQIDEYNADRANRDED